MTQKQKTIRSYQVPDADSMMRGEGRVIRVQRVDLIEHEDGERSLLAIGTRQSSPGSREVDVAVVPVRRDDLPQHIARHII